MPRNMSFMLTTDQIRDRSKTVTRRNGWTFLKPGDLVWAVEKAMGLKKGEKVKRLALLRVLSNQRVQLDTITGSDCVREGFPEMTAVEFVDFYCRYNAVKPDALVSRIEFEYVEDRPCPTISVAFAVNDEYGQTTGWIDAVDFGLEQLHVENTDGRPMRFTQLSDERIRVGRKTFPIQGYRSWLGNMMWEGVRVDIQTASRIAECLRDSGKYAPDMGYETIWDQWKAGLPITLEVE